MNMNMNLTRVFPFYNNGLWGYFNDIGQTVVSPIYEDALFFSDGLASIKQGGKWGFINELGGVVISPQYNEPGYFSEGFAWVESESQHILLSADGQEIIRYKLTEFDSVDIYYDGLARIMKDQLYGYVNTKGEIVIYPKFEEAGSYSEGLTLVTDENKETYMLDTTGSKAILNNNYRLVNNFSDGLAEVLLNNFRPAYIDKNGTVVLGPFQHYVGEFSNGFAMVQIGGKFGYMDQSGKIIIKPIYESAYIFKLGVALVLEAEEMFMINKNGDKLYTLRPDADVDCETYSLNSEIFKVMYGEKEAYINRFTGKEVFVLPKS